MSQQSTYQQLKMFAHKICDSGTMLKVIGLTAFLILRLSSLSQEVYISCKELNTLNISCSKDYIITNKIVEIHKEVNKKSIYKKNGVDSQKLNDLINYVKTEKVFELDTLYNGGWIDGTSLEFLFKIDGAEKKILLINYPHPVLDCVVFYMNEFFPAKYSICRPSIH